jgi:hypothetical protein
MHNTYKKKLFLIHFLHRESWGSFPKIYDDDDVDEKKTAKSE